MRVLAAAMVFVGLAAASASAQALEPFNTARLYLTEADFNRAIQPYQQAVTADARNARAHYWLGFAYLYGYRQFLIGAAPYASGYLPRAVASLTEAIKLQPEATEAYLQLHDAYQFMGDLDKAHETIQQMLQKTRPKWLPAVPAR